MFSTYKLGLSQRRAAAERRGDFIVVFECRRVRPNLRSIVVGPEFGVTTSFGAALRLGRSSGRSEDDFGRSFGRTAEIRGGREKRESWRGRRRKKRCRRKVAAGTKGIGWDVKMCVCVCVCVCFYIYMCVFECLSVRTRLLVRVHVEVSGRERTEKSCPI